MEQNRGSWSSNLGFLLAAVGSAVGMGNLWGFPYKMGANGGLYFLLIYLAMVIFAGVIIVGIEMAIGRNTGKSPILAMATLGKRWKIFGVFSVVAPFLIMGFYSVLVGYALRYVWGYLISMFGGDGFAGLVGGADFFVAFTKDVPAVILFTGVCFLICGFIVSRGVKKGLESFNKYAIPCLFLILVGLAIYNFSLEGWQQGYLFMFTSKGLEMAGQEFHFFTALRVAAGQMLFSLSLGMGIMVTFGSYLDKKENISVNAWKIPALDTMAAILAGLVIFPAVFATGNDPKGGPGLLFMVMKDVFTTMGGVGNVVGFFFYVLVALAGITSVISLMEVISSAIIDNRIANGKTPSRKTVSFVAALGMFALSLLIAIDQLGMMENPWFFQKIYGTFDPSSQDLLDLFDLIAEGILLPLASIGMCLLLIFSLRFKWLSDEIESNGNKFYTKGFFKVGLYTAPILMVFALFAITTSVLGWF